MDLTTIFLIATAIAGIVAAVTEVIKRTFNIPARFLPLTALVLGVLIGLAAQPLAEGAAWYIMAWAGALAGLSAAGLFDLTKINYTNGTNSTNK